MNYFLEVTTLKDDVLVTKLSEFVKRERNVTVQILVHIQEVEERKLFAVMGYSSMYNRHEALNFVRSRINMK